MLAPWLGTTALAQPRGEVLYNGIHLGTPWPPNNRYFSPDPIEPPYLADPPAVIPIDLGRQLFVDDFLIEESSLARTFHRAVYHPASPVLRPETPWERRDEYADRTQTKPNPAAMVFSDGVVFDPKDRLFKMWYMGGYGQNTCLATSTDGINWNRPTFDVVKGTNIVVRDLRDSSTVWLDHDNLDGGGRYKLAYYNGSEGGIILQTSEDGVHWQRRGLAKNRGDRSTFFWNPFRKVWVFSLRDDINGRERHRRYYETRDFASASWDAAPPPLWTGADALDARRPEYNTPPELYCLDCVAYESVILGLFTIWHGERPEREKPNDVSLGFSRDGFHWSRPNRDAFLGVSDAGRRVELGQRAAGRWLLPGGWRRPVLLRERPPGRARHQSTWCLHHRARHAPARWLRVLDRRSRDPATGPGALVAGKRHDQANAVFRL